MLGPAELIEGIALLQYLVSLELGHLKLGLEEHEFLFPLRRAWREGPLRLRLVIAGCGLIAKPLIALAVELRVHALRAQRGHVFVRSGESPKNIVRIRRNGMILRLEVVAKIVRLLFNIEPYAGVRVAWRLLGHLLLLFQVILEPLDLALVDQILNVDLLLVGSAVRAVVGNLGAAGLAGAKTVESIHLSLLVVGAAVIWPASFLASFPVLAHLVVDGERTRGLEKELGPSIITVVAVEWSLLATSLTVSVARRGQVDLLILARPDALRDHFLRADEGLLLLSLRLAVRPRLLALRRLAVGEGVLASLGSPLLLSVPIGFAHGPVVMVVLINRGIGGD